MTSSQYGPYTQGCTRATMAGTEGADTARWRKPLESRPQFGLGSATRPHEVGFASNGASAFGAVNAFPGLVHTARHIMKAVCTRSRAFVRLRCGW